MAEYWIDPSGNIRRMEGEQDILATVTDSCSEHEVAAILDALEIKFANYDGLKLGMVARISAAMMRSLLSDQRKVWPMTPNASLGGRTPEDAVMEGDGEAVLKLLENPDTKPSL